DAATVESKTATMKSAMSQSGTGTRAGISWTIEDLNWLDRSVIHIISAGRVDNTGTTRRVGLRYKRLEVLPPITPAAEAAYTCFGDQCLVGVGGSAFVDGHDWDVPTSFDCQGAGCNGSQRNPGDHAAVTGIFLPDNGTIAVTGNNGQGNAPSHFDGDPA